MVNKKENINNIPSSFLFNTLTNYQIQTVQIHWYIYNRLNELELEYGKHNKMVCYQIIADELGYECVTVQKSISKSKRKNN
jgi:hypothetical protein